MKNPKHLHLPYALAVWLLALLSSNPALADNDEHHSPVVSPQTCAQGKTYAQWSIEWWRWATKLPADHHPIFDTADISAGQTGDVWFLGPKFCRFDLVGCTGIATRSGIVPANKSLFICIAGGECSAVEGNGSTFIDFRNCAQPFVDALTSLECDIDGKSVPHLVEQFRFLSPLFTYTMASRSNIWAAIGESVPNGATTTAVSDGYWVFLEPLPLGRHTIHFHAEIQGVIEDIIYHLTVARGGDDAG